MNFNFNEFLESQNQINNSLITSNTKIVNAVQSIKEEGIEVISKEVGQLKTNFNKLENNFKIVKSDLEETKAENTKLKSELEDLHNKLYILKTDDYKMMELKKITHNQARKHTGVNGSIEYILFYSYFMAKCRGTIKTGLNVPNLGAISINDFEVACRLAERWFPTKKIINDKIFEYQNKQKNGTLSKELSEALDTYLRKINKR